MSNMKCVKCNSDLEQIGDFYTCTNPHCTLCGDKDMWQELIKVMEENKRTRKALDVALDKLKRIQKIYTNAPFNVPINYANVCTDMYDVATEQIKELDNE